MFHLASGLPYHMTPQREWFITFKSSSCGFVYLDDDKTCDVTGMGQIKIDMDEEGDVRTLNDVIYIP